MSPVINPGATREAARPARVSSPLLSYGPSGPPAPAFSINFIRGETVSLRVRRLLMSLALVYLAAHLLLLAGLLWTAFHAHLQRQRLVLQVLSGAAPLPRTARAVQEEMEMRHRRAEADLAQLGALVAQQQLRFPVGGKLAALSKTLPARTWITGIAGTRERRTIAVQATYLIDPERPYELPIKTWLEALRNDPAFRQGLTRLDLGTSSRKTQGSAELVLFELLAEWQPLAAR